jgi:hypothetical protein
MRLCGGLHESGGHTPHRRRPENLNALYHDGVTVKLLQFYLLIAGVFSVLAALCAFVITYGEYLKHFPDKKKPLRIAAKMAPTAFMFFMLLTLLVISVIHFF